MKAAALYTVIARLRADLFMAKRHREAGSSEALRREASARNLGKVAINLVNSMRLDEARPGNRTGELEAIVFDLAEQAPEGSRLRYRAFRALGICEPLNVEETALAESAAAISSMLTGESANPAQSSQDADYFHGGIRLDHDMIRLLAVIGEAFSDEILVLHRNPGAGADLFPVSVHLDAPLARLLDVLQPATSTSKAPHLHVVQP